MRSHKALKTQVGLIVVTAAALLLAACGPKEAPGAKPATSGQPAAANPASSGPTLAPPAAKTEPAKPEAAAGAAAPAAKNYKLPDVINWVTLDVGSATYNVHQAIAHATSG